MKSLKVLDVVGYLIKLEWLKFRRNSTVRNGLLLYTLLLPGAIFMAQQIKVSTSGNFDLMGNIFDFPAIWKLIGYTGSWLTFIFMGYLSIVLSTHEFENKTWRQNIIDGLRRKDLLISKILSILAISLYATLVYIICVLIFGVFNADNFNFSSITEDLTYIPLYLLMCAGYMTFGFFLAVFIRKTGPAIISYLAWAFFLESAIRWGFHKNIIDNKSMHFYPMNAIEDLMPVPFREQAELFIQQNDYEYFLSTNEAVIATLAYCILFISLSYFRLERSDL